MERIGIGMLTCMTDEHCTLLHVSDNFLNFTGYSREEIRMRFKNRYYELMVPEDVNRLQSELARQKTSDNELSLKYRLVRKSGEPVQVFERSCFASEDGVRCCYCEICDQSRTPDRVNKDQDLEPGYEASFDLLTELYNRETVLSMIRRMLGESGKIDALILVDIDDFKVVNATFGHAFGDTVLSDTAARLRGIFRKRDPIGRLDGDEFVIFLPGLTDKKIAMQKAERICEAMRVAYQSGEKSKMVSGSVGIAFFPEHGKDVNVLYEKAKIALHHAKNMGKNRHAAYLPELAD